MKTLLLIRHAKSSWDHSILHDGDRPLNDRGRRDAPEMAGRLVRAGIPIGRFVSSPAKRARKTAELFIREYGRKEEEILFLPELYHPAVQTFYEVIATLDDVYDQAAIFSHNPGITAFINSLGVVQLENMPTCGIFAVRCAASSWTGFSSSGKEFLFFDYPKSLPG